MGNSCHVLYQFAQYFQALEDGDISELKGECKEDGKTIEYNEVPDLTDNAIAWIERNLHAVEVVVAGIGMSECNLGGDNLILTIRDVMEALTNGYTWIYTYYGDDTEAICIAAKRPIHRALEIHYIFEDLEEKTAGDALGTDVIYNITGACRVRLVKGDID